MRATEVLQKCLHDALGSMYALRSRVLLRAKAGVTISPLESIGSHLLFPGRAEE